MRITKIQTFFETLGNRLHILANLNVLKAAIESSRKDESFIQKDKDQFCFEDLMKCFQNDLATGLVATALATGYMLILIFLLSDSHIAFLSTSSRWIVNANSGRRVKLACVNWPGHMNPLVPEGLHKVPLKNITRDIASMGFNCVRLTWSTEMFTNKAYTNLTVTQSLERWNLVAASYGMAINNPDLMNKTLIETQKAVIDALGHENLMVILDNHVSFPIWCCDWNDGNGFFKDVHFNPVEWVQGLSTVARRYKGNPTV